MARMKNLSTNKFKIDLNVIIGYQKNVLVKANISTTLTKSFEGFNTFFLRILFFIYISHCIQYTSAQYTVYYTLSPYHLVKFMLYIVGARYKTVYK